MDIQLYDIRFTKYALAARVFVSQYTRGMNLLY